MPTYFRPPWVGNTVGYGQVDLYDRLVDVVYTNASRDLTWLGHGLYKPPHHCGTNTMCNEVGEVSIRPNALVVGCKCFNKRFVFDLQTWQGRTEVKSGFGYTPISTGNYSGTKQVSFGGTQYF